MRVSVLGLLLAATTVSAQSDPFVPRVLRAFVADSVRLDYLLVLPDGYDAAPERAWPLVLFLHGSGERGQDLDRVKAHGPPRRVAEGARFPFILVAPQAPDGTWWDAGALGTLLDEVEAAHRVDPDRVSVTGLSMGGFGAWALAETFPRRFAAVAPVCGGGTPGRICAAATTPVWAFHGALDDVVSVQRSMEMVQRLERCGGDVRLTLYPDAGHDSWTATYADPALYEWILAQRRPGSRGTPATVRTPHPTGDR